MPDFGFFSWPEPGVSSYVEVRQQTLDRERGIAAGRLDDHKRDSGDENDLGESADSATEAIPKSWSKKIPKLIWRGVPMVPVRQVSNQ